MPYPIELRERVLESIDQGMSKWEAHQIFKVSRSTIDDWLKLREETGSVAANTNYQRGPKRAIEDNDENREFFEKHHQKTLEEMRTAWFEANGEWLSDVTMSKTLKRFGYTRKKRPISTKSEMKKNVKTILKS